MRFATRCHAESLVGTLSAALAAEVARVSKDDTSEICYREQFLFVADPVELEAWIRPDETSGGVRGYTVCEPHPTLVELRPA